MKVTISANQLKSAMGAIDKKERPIFKMVHIKSNDSMYDNAVILETCDGKTLYTNRIECISVIKETIDILVPYHTVPKADLAIIDTDSIPGKVLIEYRTTKTTTNIVVDAIDGVFPNTASLGLEGHLSDSENTFYFDLELLNRVTKIFGKVQVKMECMVTKNLTEYFQVSAPGQTGIYKFMPIARPVD